MWHFSGVEIRDENAARIRAKKRRQGQAAYFPSSFRRIHAVRKEASAVVWCQRIDVGRRTVARVVVN
jgi:hypothetical protein